MDQDSTASLPFPSITDSAPSSTLTIVEAVDTPSLKDTALASFVPIEKHLGRLAEKYRAVAYDVTIPRGMTEAKAARNELREQGRYPVQRLRDRLKREANDLKRILDDKAEEMIAIVAPVEAVIDGQIKAEETRIEAERAEKVRIESERVAALEARYAGLLAYLDRCKEPGMTAARVARGMGLLEEIEIGDDWQEYRERAIKRKADVWREMDELSIALASREDADKQAAIDRAEAQRIAEQQRVQAAALAAERAEIEAERARTQRIRSMLAEIKAAATGHENASVADLCEAIRHVELIELSEDVFGEFLIVAEGSVRLTLNALQQQLSAAIEREPKAPAEIEPEPAAALPEPVAPAIEAPKIIAPVAQAEAVEQMNLGTINRRLGFDLNVAFIIDKLGINPTGRDKRAVLWPVSSWEQIKGGIIVYIEALP